MGPSNLSHTVRHTWMCLLLMLSACGQRDVVGELSSAPAVPARPGSADAPGDAPALAAGAVQPEPQVTDAATSAGAVGCASASSVFSQALCACDDVIVSGNLRATTLGSEGQAGVRVSGALLAPGLRGPFRGPIDGDLTLVGSGPSFIAGEDARIEGSLRASTDLFIEGLASVGGDAVLEGALFGLGTLVVEGDLYRPSTQPSLTATTEATVDLAGEERVAQTQLAAPCACDAASTLDIAGWVDEARADNDNALVDFSASDLEAAPPGGVLELPPGRVFAPALAAEGNVTLQVSGVTTLFIGGDLVVQGDLRAELAPDAELTVFVAGDMAVRGALALGSASRPGAGRLYVAGVVMAGRALPPETPGLDLVDSLQVDASEVAPEPGMPIEWMVNLYAPSFVFEVSQGTIHGSLYVRSLVTGGDLELRYDPSVAVSEEACDAR